MTVYLSYRLLLKLAARRMSHAHEDVSDFIGELRIETTDKPESNICQFHNDQTFTAKCKQCEQLVCIKCIVTTHKGHIFDDLVELLEPSSVIIKQIQKETLEKKWLAYLHKENTGAQAEVNRVQEHNERTRREIQNVHLSLVEKIDSDRDTLLSALEKDLAKAKDRQTKIQNKMAAVAKDLEVIAQTLAEGSTVDIIRLSLKLQSKYLENVPTYLNENIASARKTRFLSRVDDVNVLGEKHVVPELEVYGVYQTSMAVLSTVRNLLEDETWIAGVHSPQGIRLHVPRQKHSSAMKYKFRKTFVYSIVFTKSTTNTLALMSFANVHEIRAIDLQRVNDEDGVVFTDLRDMFPLGLEVSQNGDVYACASERYSKQMSESIKRGVFRISKFGQVLNFFQFVEDTRKCLFSYPSCLTENTDGVICVIDRKSNSSGRVVALNHLGKKVFTYERPPNSTPTEHVDLKYITHDTVGNIFISDFSNNRVHMISRSGHFVAIVMGPEEAITITSPAALHADEFGNLWIGCASDQNLIHTCQVMKIKMNLK